MIGNNNNRRNNPTASPYLKNSEFNNETRTSGIKPRYNDMDDVRLLCASCTIFDEKQKAIKRVELIHEKMHGLFRCPINHKHVFSEKQVRHVLRLDLPEYVYYDEDSPKEIDEINRERESTEKWIIKPINSESPDNRAKNKKVAKIIK